MKPREEIVEAIVAQMEKEVGAPGNGVLAEIGRSMARTLARDIVASGLRYLNVGAGKALMCLQCGMVSHNPDDVAQRYCGACHEFLDDPQPPEAA
jgi:hypothetical protein